MCFFNKASKHQTDKELPTEKESEKSKVEGDKTENDSSKVLEPTDKNIQLTLEEDRLDRNKLLNHLYEIICKEDNPKMVVIDGSWGSGKTFFVKQMYYVIKNIHYSPGEKPDGYKLCSEIITSNRSDIDLNVVYYDAWKNDNSLLPLQSIALEIVQEYKLSAYKEEIDFQKLTDALENITNIIPSDIIPMISFIRNLPTIVNLVINLIVFIINLIVFIIKFIIHGFITKENIDCIIYTIINPIKSSDKFKNIIRFIKEVKLIDCIIDKIKAASILKKEDSLQELSKERDLEKPLQNFLAEALPKGKENRLIIFIDELDRCKPSFAIQLLEQVKHYMSYERLMFVFAVNMGELQHSVKHFYGNDFNAWRYLDRFFDYRFSLPPVPSVNKEAFYNDIFGGTADDKTTNDRLNYTHIDVAKRILELYAFELRDSIHFINHIKAVGKMLVNYDKDKDNKYKDEDKDKEKRKAFGEKAILLYIVPLIIALHYVDENLYREFKEGKNSQPLEDLFNSDWGSYFLDEIREDDASLKKNAIIPALYRAIFINKSDTYLGKYLFTSDSKNYAIRCEFGVAR